MKVIQAMLLSALQFMALAATYVGLASALVEIVPRLYPEYATYYGLYNGIGDAQMILIVYLLWNVHFGPYSVHYKRMSRFLKKADKRWDDE